MDWKKVLEKYSDEYLRTLAIEHHIFELHAKLQKALAEDKCPFRQKEFLKELADLYLLLDMHRLKDDSFTFWVLSRKTRFIMKLEEKQWDAEKSPRKW